MTTIEHPTDNRVGGASKGWLLAPVVGIVAAIVKAREAELGGDVD